MSPERSAQIETILLRMAQSGQLRGRVSEEQLIDLLNQVRVGLLPRCEQTLKLLVLIRWRRLRERQGPRSRPLWCVR